MQHCSEQRRFPGLGVDAPFWPFTHAARVLPVADLTLFRPRSLRTIWRIVRGLEQDIPIFFIYVDEHRIRSYLPYN